VMAVATVVFLASRLSVRPFQVGLVVPLPSVTSTTEATSDQSTSVASDRSAQEDKKVTRSTAQLQRKAIRARRFKRGEHKRSSRRFVGCRNRDAEYLQWADLKAQPNLSRGPATTSYLQEVRGARISLLLGSSRYKLISTPSRDPAAAGRGWRRASGGAPCPDTDREGLTTVALPSSSSWW
jgi:hypothetical protein